MFPPAIIFINGNIDGYGSSYGDIDTIGKATLQSQLYLNEIMTGTEFDSRVVSNPNYPTIVHMLQYRILVIRPDFMDTNRELADVVLALNNGMVIVEKNNCGPPGLTLALANINIYQLLRYNSSQYVAIIPSVQSSGSSLGGIFAILSRDTSGVNVANEDRESNNTDFINRR